jgi:uncharacterized LabA/DUF88 family protein
MTTEEERIALFLDYENLAIGTRENLDGLAFDFKPLAEALAERGRVVVRRAYADWSFFSEDRRMLTRHHVELIEIPQRLGARKNAADIKMSVDAMEMCFERDYLTTFVIGTGDSDFTALVHKLRELNKRVIGVGVKASTSPLLPAACDEFLFYEALEGVEPGRGRRRPKPKTETATRSGAKATGREGHPAAPPSRASDHESRAAERETHAKVADVDEMTATVVQTLAGMGRSGGEVILASSLKRALLRKNSTFSEADYGFRTFGELLRYLGGRKVLELSEGTAKGDPEVALTDTGGGQEEAFAMLRSVVAELDAKGTPALMSGLKQRLRKLQPAFTEKSLGYNGFLQFCKAATTRGLVTLEWSDDADDYVLHAAG